MHTVHPDFAIPANRLCVIPAVFGLLSLFITRPFSTSSMGIPMKLIHCLFVNYRFVLQKKQKYFSFLSGNCTKVMRTKYIFLAVSKTICLQDHSTSTDKVRFILNKTMVNGSILSKSISDQKILGRRLTYNIQNN
jgi:hypothetical protein